MNAGTSTAAGVEWRTQPQAADLVAELTVPLLSRIPFANHLAERMLQETGTRIGDWIDHLVYPQSEALIQKLTTAGFEQVSSPVLSGLLLWQHPGGLFPEIRLHETATCQMVLKVESVSDFLLAHSLTLPRRIEGAPLAAARKALIAFVEDAELWVIERNAGRSEEVSTTIPDTTAVLEFSDRFRLRQRQFVHDSEGFDQTRTLLREAITALGVGRTCVLFFAAERAYWQARNRAARIQKARQDALGLGWANHDHHTYRSSRAHFAELMSLCSKLGFVQRERFYAGRVAGWGAQVLEQPDTGIVIFADVDLSPEEVTTDFARQPLPPRDQLGTIGLWCALHGEAFLQAGMHHLECQFDFEAAAEQLGIAGVATMKPFTDFPHLRQAFTQGEIWTVDEQRIAALEQTGRITAEQAEKFRREGALGSHLEVLQRDDGYKGFNMTGINEIILGTDPRHVRH